MQLVVPGRFADVDRIKAGRFQEYVRSIFCDSRFESPENPGDAHAGFGIADHQVAGPKRTFLLIEGNKRSALGHGLHKDLLARDHAGIKGMQGLPGLMEHKVGNIHHVVDGGLADGKQAIL